LTKTECLLFRFHVYFDIDLDRVWDTVTDDLPGLITMLERIEIPT